MTNELRIDPKKSCEISFLMDVQTPLIREGMKPSGGKATVFFRIMVVFAVHLLFIGGLLVQGCKQTSIKSLDTALPEPNANPTPAKVAPPQTSPPAAKAAPIVPAIKAAVVSPASDATFYTVKPSDTLAQIAQSHHTSVKKLKDLNGLKTNSIVIGQKLKLPPAKVA